MEIGESICLVLEVLPWEDFAFALLQLIDKNVKRLGSVGE